MTPDLATTWDRLWPQVLAGDRAAFGMLLEHYRNYLALLSRMDLRQRLQRQVAESDLVQQTFLEAHRDLHQFQGQSEGEFVAWLKQLMATNVANQLRRFYGTQKRRTVLERELQTELDQASGLIDRALTARDESPSQHATRHERAVLVADAIAALSADYREVIIGRQFEGLSFADLAQRLERSEDSVQKLWVRGLAKLKSTLMRNGVP
jgi:RNA polymerase sigma-70 factor (ECF subfamily)